MDGKLLIFSAVLVASITLNLVPITAQRKGAPQDASKSNQVIEESAEQRKRADERNQAVVNELRTLHSEIATIRDQTDRIEREKATQKSAGGPPLWSNWFLVGVAALTAVFAWRTLRAIEKEVEATTKAANAAADSVTESRKSAAIADRSAQAASDSAAAAADTLKTNREIERAYITFGHRDVVINYGRDSHSDSDPTKPQSIGVTISIRNVGKTPGDVLGGFIGYRISDTPGLPDITRVFRRFEMGFLLPDKEFSFQTRMDEGTENLLRLFNPAQNDRIWLVGEIDYEDRFGGLHTCSYGRWFTPMGINGRPSFESVQETAPFNWDRPMTDAKKKHYAKS